MGLDQDRRQLLASAALQIEHPPPPRPELSGHVPRRAPVGEIQLAQLVLRLLDRVEQLPRRSQSPGRRLHHPRVPQRPERLRVGLQRRAMREQPAVQSRSARLISQGWHVGGCLRLPTSRRQRLHPVQRAQLRRDGGIDRRGPLAPRHVREPLSQRESPGQWLPALLDPPEPPSDQPSVDVHHQRQPVTRVGPARRAHHGQYPGQPVPTRQERLLLAKRPSRLRALHDRLRQELHREPERHHVCQRLRVSSGLGRQHRLGLAQSQGGGPLVTEDLLQTLRPHDLRRRQQAAVDRRPQSQRRQPGAPLGPRHLVAPGDQRRAGLATRSRIRRRLAALERRHQIREGRAPRPDSVEHPPEVVLVLHAQQLPRPAGQRRAHLSDRAERSALARSLPVAGHRPRRATGREDSCLP